LISAIAGILLLASMVILLFQLPVYVRGRALESQVHLARTVQQKFLPEPTTGGIEFAGECIPAEQVLADVSGKGLPAALRMGIVHGAIRTLSLGNIDSGIARMAERLNELLRERSSHEFVTLFWAFDNPERRDLRYVNACHPPPLLVAPSGDLLRLEKGGPVLGLLPRTAYQEGRLSLDGDECLIAYSDGLLEATDPAGEEFGESSLLPVLRGTNGQSAQTVLRLVMEAASRFIEGGDFHNDLTVLVTKLAERDANLPQAPVLPNRALLP
jgi:serine phosphatase RsbU (regulator of sigma subunit)